MTAEAAEKQINITHQQILWQPKVDGRTVDVPIHVVANDQNPDVLFMAGWGAGERVATGAVRALGQAALNVGAVVQLPFKYLAPTSINIERVITEAPVAIAQTWNERADKPADTPINAVGHSGGGGIALWSAGANPEQFGALGLLAPAGLNKNALGSNTIQRRHELVRRLFIENNLKSGQSVRHLGNWTTSREITGQLLQDMRRGGLRSQLDIGVDHDLTEAVKELQSDHLVRIFAGEDDPVFRAAELAASLGSIGCKDLLQIIPGSHSSPLSPDGRRQLQSVGRWMHDAKTS